MTTTEIENVQEMLMDCLLLLKQVDIDIKDEMLNIIYCLITELDCHLLDEKELTNEKLVEIRMFTENAHSMLQTA